MVIQKPTPRVLHVVESLDRGAVETWLIRMLKHANSCGVKLDWSFYCTIRRPGKLDEATRALGAEVIHSPVPITEKLTFVQALRAQLRRGKYDVLHCHHDLVSAVYLFSALGLPLRKRLVHVHNADEDVLTPSILKQLLFRSLFRGACFLMADNILGISDHTLDTFRARRPRRTGRDIVHYYGIDPLPFQSARRNREEIRRQLGFDENSKILLFAGRMVPEKNPIFAVDVLAEMRRTDPHVVGIFVGAGSLDDASCRRAAQLGVSSAFRYLGWRNDVADIMCACDWFILPHPENVMEGFGIAVVEAQLAGLRLLLSRGIADDPLLPTACFRRISLAEGPKAWAEAAAELWTEPTPFPFGALSALKESRFAMDTALADLVAIHSCP